MNLNTRSSNFRQHPQETQLLKSSNYLMGFIFFHIDSRPLGICSTPRPYEPTTSCRSHEKTLYLYKWSYNKRHENTLYFIKQSPLDLVTQLEKTCTVVVTVRGDPSLLVPVRSPSSREFYSCKNCNKFIIKFFST